MSKEGIYYIIISGLSKKLGERDREFQEILFLTEVGNTFQENWSGSQDETTAAKHSLPNPTTF